MSYLEKFQQRQPASPAAETSTPLGNAYQRAHYDLPRSVNAQRMLVESMPELLEIQADRMEEVVELEQRCYPSPWSAGLVRGEFNKEVSYRLGLLLEGKVVAYSFCYLIPQDLHILNIAVAPEQRGKGFGKYLLCNLLTRAIDANVTLVGLEVRPSNAAARALYARLGFQAVGIRRGYYRDNGEDALLLERNLGAQDLAFFKKFSQDSSKG